MHFFTHCTHEAQGIAVGANHEIHPAAATTRKVHRGERLRSEGLVTDVADDTDDLESVRAHHGDKTLAQRFFIRKNYVDELLADDRDFIALPDFLFGEVAPAQQGNVQRTEVTRIDRTEVGVKRLIDRDCRPSFDVERNVV